MSKLVSVIVPVYNAEKTLRKCVESIVYGRYANVEVILVDDCSRDGSWGLCCQLRDSYPQVKCVQNPVNSGVSVTRNHGLDVATGEYICFADSDDWVSCRFVETLVSEAEQHPQEFPVCGFRFVDYIENVRTDSLMDMEGFLPRKESFRLLTKSWMQCVWNKIFSADIIESHHIRFEPGKNMGEDFDFVLSYLMNSNVTGYRIIDRPLYYYVRCSTTSLMSQFGLTSFEEEMARYYRVYQICNDAAEEKTYQEAVEGLRQNFMYHIVRADKLSKAEKIQRIQKIVNDRSAEKQYCRCVRAMQKEWLIHKLLSIKKKMSIRYGECVRKREAALGQRMRKGVTDTAISIISQNCIGGVCYHDMGQQFLSPTVDLYIAAPDFIKLIGDLRKYLVQPLELQWDEEYPVGHLDDLEIRFMHYETCSEAKLAWERRCQRIDWDKILVLTTDRDGFTETEFEHWVQLPYPKVLYTAQEKFAGHEDSVYFGEYRADGCVPDLIPGRKFYRGGAVIRAIRRCAEKK